MSKLVICAKNLFQISGIASFLPFYRIAAGAGIIAWCATSAAVAEGAELVLMRTREISPQGIPVASLRPPVERVGYANRGLAGCHADNRYLMTPFALL
jgi:hypothetical protein